jgi:hypothetical protein
MLFAQADGWIGEWPEEGVDKGFGLGQLRTGDMTLANPTSIDYCIITNFI